MEHETKVTGQTKDAGFQFGLRKTFLVNAETAWDYLFTEEGLSIWLGTTKHADFELKKPFITEEGNEGTLNVLKPYSHVRLTWKKPGWADLSSLQIRVLDNKGKVTIAIHQDQLEDADMRDEAEVYWNGVMDKLGLKLGD
jgi:uncharacterized protein YndB with AHSA1/START domain